MSTQSDDLTDLSGRVAVVTGAAAGLGRAEAIGLARSGATVVVNDMADARRVLEAARNLMKEKFGLEHVTIQIEDAALAAQEARLAI